MRKGKVRLTALGTTVTEPGKNFRGHHGGKEEESAIVQGESTTLVRYCGTFVGAIVVVLLAALLLAAAVAAVLGFWSPR